MMLDMRTILVVTVVMNVIIVCTTWQVHFIHGKKYGGTFSWFLCFLLNSIGNLLLGCRDILPDSLSIVLANSLLCIGIMSLVKASIEMTGRKFPLWPILVVAIPFTVWYWFFSYIQPSLQPRALLSSSLTVACCLFSAVILLRSKRHEFLPGVRIFLVMALVFCMRLFYVVYKNYNGSWFHSVPFDRIFMLCFLCTYLILGFAYLSMVDALVLNDLRLSDERNSLLFHEMRHRTKNNLALISGLVSLQSSSVHDEKAKAAFDVLQSRLNTISSVYRLLSSGEEDEKSDVREYLSSVLAGIRDGQLAGSGIVFSIELDALSLKTTSLVPLGLIVNELVTNSVKHAFKGIESPEIRIRLAVREPQVTLTVEDNGVGMLPGAADSGGVGMSLVHALASQLGGKLSYSSAPSGGTLATLGVGI